MLKWLKNYGSPCNSRTTSQAVKGGHWEVVKYLRSQNYPWDERTCAEAAGKGDLGFLQWLRSEGCPWDVNTSRMAAKGGHLKVSILGVHEQIDSCVLLKREREKKTHLCCFGFLFERTFVTLTHFYAISLQLLKWAAAQGCRMDADTCSEAATGGHLEVLKWLVDDQDCAIDRWTCYYAAQEGHLEVKKKK